MTRYRISFVAALSFAACLMMITAHATAHPLPNRDILKFSQQPMINTTIPGPTGQPQSYFGHDQVSTAYSIFDTAGGGNIIGYQGQFMADDFADRFDSPVVHVRWWGSYIRDQIYQPVDKFLISFEADIPADPATGNFSRPGQPLLNQVVYRGPLSPGSGTFTEDFVRGPDPIVGESLYEYNAELHLDKEFFQEPDTVYWLKIVALVDVDQQTSPDLRTQWGWHNRDYTVPNPLASVPPAVSPGEFVDGFIGPDIAVWHFQDNAVDGFVNIDVTQQGGEIMPEIVQDVGGPTYYLDIADGPDGISQFSKDLAFELFTVPEPTTGLLLFGGLMVAIRRRSYR